MKRIGRYDLHDRIGAGGYANVYLAQDTRLDIPVAIKVMNKSVSSGLEQVEALRQEARTSARLAHENIAQVRDFLIEDDYACIVMEYIPDSLDSLIGRELAITPIKAIELFSQICNALSYAHSENIVHQDIKPQNILIDANGNAKVSDFGLSKLVDDSLIDAGYQEGIPGTPTYMAPEQFLGDSVPDIRSDIYSLGVSMYEILSGAPPFQGNFPDLFRMHTQEKIPEFAISLNIPKELAKIVYKCLEKDPNSRYQNTEEIRVALHGLTNSSMLFANNRLPNSRNLMHRASTWTTAIGVAGIVAAVIFLGLRSSDKINNLFSIVASEPPIVQAPLLLPTETPVPAQPPAVAPKILVPTFTPTPTSTPTPTLTPTPYVPVFIPLAPTAYPLSVTATATATSIPLPTIEPTPIVTSNMNPFFAATSVPTAVPVLSNHPEIVVADGALFIQDRKDVKVEYKNIPWDKNPPVAIELYWHENVDGSCMPKTSINDLFYKEIEQKGSGDFFINKTAFEKHGLGKYRLIARDSIPGYPRNHHGRTPIACSEIFEVLPNPTATPRPPRPTQTPVPSDVLVYGDLRKGEVGIGYGDITEKGQKDEWYFHGRAGEEVIITLTNRGGALDPEIELISPNNERIAHNRDHEGSYFISQIGTNTFPSVLPLTGKYKINVKAETTATCNPCPRFGDKEKGSYVIELKFFPYKSGIRLQNGDTYYGELQTSNSVMDWYFSGRKGQLLSVAIEPNIDDFVPSLHLYHGWNHMERAADITGTIQSSESILIKDHDLESHGEYRLRVGKIQDGKQGSYRYKICMTLSDSPAEYIHSECESIR